MEAEGLIALGTDLFLVGIVTVPLKEKVDPWGP
jgi:hypothetical protein